MGEGFEGSGEEFREAGKRGTQSARDRVIGRGQDVSETGAIAPRKTSGSIR
ncbi:hypothetical protein [Phormidium sp. CCY1219]|uniref:hypothetical protein n=1 Tax=Phormidium sp. CCY1219 TaxID=2886104 RepID=UPI002D1F7791|nr:hypothetical protein [Phormidium sp. CCY1219]MEB3828840.1 hypothetical protein [Phormidium sp. CCY1219]